MHGMKKMLPVFCILILLIFSLSSPAAACFTGDGEGTSGQKIPMKIYFQEDDSEVEYQPIVYRFEIPLQSGERKTIKKLKRITCKKGYPVFEPTDPKPPEAEPTEPSPTEPEPGPTDPEPSPPEASPVLSADEMQMLQLVNEERQNAGLEPLQIHEGLIDLARLKSEDMINLGYFSHQSPTYGSPFDMITGAGITYRTAGENIAGAPTVDRAHQALMNSAGHRANILNANFTHIGIGIVDGGPYGKMFTQMFIGQS